MALPEAKTVIIYAVVFGIAIIAIMFGLKVISQPMQVCGNSNIEFPEQCDNYGCSSNEFCNSNCRCQKESIEKPLQQSTCPELGGIVCGIGSSCSIAPIKINNELCCLSSCINKPPELPPINSSSPIDSIDERQEVVDIFKNGEISRSAAAAVANLGCTLSTGEVGVICEGQYCTGVFEDLCCFGNCDSFQYSSYEECLSFCFEEGSLSNEECDIKCR